MVRGRAAAAGTDHWAVLGLAPGADPAALKRAFRAQARRWHPDLNGNDPVAEERFKQVNEAYAVLSDPRRRRAWESGEPDPEGGSAREVDPFASGFPSFETYVEQLFGAPRREAAAGDPRTDDFRTGAQPASADPSRGGSVEPSATPPPPVRAASASESLVSLTPEQALEGSRVEVELPDGTLLEVWTPPLAGDGWRLRLPGLGPGGADHFLQLRVVSEEGLRVDGLRVHYLLEVSPAEAVLGCRVVVPTLQGPVKLTVPAGSSSGRLLRLRGRGLRDGEEQGDQLVELRIVVPPSVSDAELALYRRLQELAQEEQ
ncbi:MAG: DnaJ C-terminal domain-containing protein [Cyanobium sp.]|nr:DnaJ C-terminal domain-containing protein [Cyanobium sp.]